MHNAKFHLTSLKCAQWSIHRRLQGRPRCERHCWSYI